MCGTHTQAQKPVVLRIAPCMRTRSRWKNVCMQGFAWALVDNSGMHTPAATHAAASRTLRLSDRDTGRCPNRGAAATAHRKHQKFRITSLLSHRPLPLGRWKRHGLKASLYPSSHPHTADRIVSLRHGHCGYTSILLVVMMVLACYSERQLRSCI